MSTFSVSEGPDLSGSAQTQGFGAQSVVAAHAHTPSHPNMTTNNTASMPPFFHRPLAGPPPPAATLPFLNPSPALSPALAPTSAVAAAQSTKAAPSTKKRADTTPSKTAVTPEHIPADAQGKAEGKKRGLPPGLDTTPRPSELLDPRVVQAWLEGQHGVQCTISSSTGRTVDGDELVSCDNGNVMIPRHHVPPDVDDSSHVVTIGALDTRNAGRWLWVSFRGKAWIVPPPLVPADPVDLFGDAKYVLYHPPTAPKASLILCYYNTFSAAEAQAESDGGETAITIRQALRKGTASFGNRPADVKLGGVCCDVPARCIKAMIETITGISIAFVEVFSAAHSGRCCVWLNDTAEADLLVQRLRGRIWMAPACHGYAVVAVGTAAQAWLCEYLTKLRDAGITRVPFPRHLLTAEKWRLL